MGVRGPKPRMAEQQEALGRTNHHAKKPKTRTLPIHDGACPAHLSGHARAMWEELAPALIKAGTLTVVAAKALESACDSYGVYRRHRDACEGMAKELGESAGLEASIRLGLRNACFKAQYNYEQAISKLQRDPANIGNMTAPSAEETADTKRAAFFTIGGKGGKK